MSGERERGGRGGGERGDERAAPVLVSACLLGLPCRYDGQAQPAPAVLAALAGRSVLPVCPETAAGLGVPRPPFRFAERPDAAGVLAARRGLPDAAGRDVAPALVPACERLAVRAVAEGATEAVLKERSPSCGVHQTHGAAGAVAGQGVFAALLVRHGLRVRSDEELAAAAEGRPGTAVDVDVDGDGDGDGGGDEVLGSAAHGGRLEEER